MWACGPDLQPEADEVGKADEEGRGGVRANKRGVWLLSRGTSASPGLTWPHFEGPVA